MGYRRQHNIKVYDQSTGDLHGIWNDGLSLSYRKNLNDIGMCVWTVPPEHPVIDLVGDDDRIEIAVTKDTSTGAFLSWETDFVGLYRESQIATDQTGNEYHLLYFPSAEDALSRAIVAYKAGTANRSLFSSTSIANIFGLIWRYNCTTDGTTADGREVDAVATLATTGTGSASSDVIDYRCAWKNVLTALQELAVLGGNTFYVTRNTSTNALSVIVDVSNVDVSEDVVFALPLNNMGQASLQENRMLEKTVAIVGGAGQESARTVRVRTGANQSATNNYEFFVDHKDTSTTDILDDRGDIALSVRQARTTIGADVLQSSGYRYLEDYEMGNIVAQSFGGVTVDRQVSSVSVRFDPFMSSSIVLEDPL